ncbi:hypothetical protein CC2G_006308 [Coprinopsis cinerea AmutBmut pab1-1]|nr:hypothetical protein CC2G_006308 [Coprinopsis cinerea AmutBmut pab1-1]
MRGPSTIENARHFQLAPSRSNYSHLAEPASLPRATTCHIQVTNSRARLVNPPLPILRPHTRSIWLFLLP